MPELIDRYATMDAIPAPTDADEAEYYEKVCDAIEAMPTIEPEVRHGRWIECDYKHMEHGMIETEPKAGLCCSECRTGFKKKNMTYKQYCPACGAKMYADGGTISKERFAEIMTEILGGADNG